MSKPSVYITGATGWLGRALLHALRTSADFGDRELKALVLEGESVDLVGKDVQITRGDVADAAAVERFADGARPGDVLFHLAGIIHPRVAAEFDRVNAGGTANVVRAFSGRGLQRAVYVSSNSPFGVNPSPYHLFDESASYRPYMGYGRSKMRAEHAVIASDVGKHPWCIVRAPWFYGPYQPARQTLFFRMIRLGKMPLFGDGSNKRSMAYVDNLAQGLLLAASSPRAVGEAFWIADARPYEMREIVETVAEVLHDDFGMTIVGGARKYPQVICQIAYLVDLSLQACGLYQQKIHVLSEMNKTIACSILKAENLLGYKPQVELREGMRRSIEWCLAQGYEI